MTTGTLLVCDLDGTLIQPSGATSAANRRGLERAVERGWTCAVATGRPSRCLDVIEPYLHLFTRVLACNGAEELTAAGRFAVVHPLDPESARLVVAGVRSIAETCSFAVEYGESFGYEPGYAHWPATDNDPTAVVATAEELVGNDRPIAKLLVKTDAHTPDALVTEVLGLLDRTVSVTHSNRPDTAGPIEIGDVEATKGASVARASAQLGFAPPDIVAFGDQLNDLSLLSMAGRAFVVGDSHHIALDRFTRFDNTEGDAVGRWVLSQLP